MHPRLTPFLAAILFLRFLAIGSAAEPSSARLVNVSARVALGGTAGTPIPGFVVAGTGQKQVIVRAAGPALSAFGVGNALADPRLGLVSGGSVVASNDNWLPSDAGAMGGVGAFAFATGSRDAALVLPVAPGPFTAPVTAPEGTSGVVLLETYDASPTGSSYLVNASTRAFVGTGDNVLIPGFVISGPGAVKVLIRAVGPTLASFGVGGVLNDPTLTLYRGNSALGSNDNWSAAANSAEIAAAGAAFGAFNLPAGSRDAALLVSLPAGSYSAVVSGVNNGTGTALVELYSEIPAPAASSTAGFLVSAVTTAPAAPNFLDATTVTALVQAPAGAKVTEVRLSYAAGGASVSLPMADDGRSGDGAAGDGVYGAVIPVQPAGATVSYTVAARDDRGGSANSATNAYLVGSQLTDALFTSAEFLGIPTQKSVALNLEASATLEVYAEYGTASGVYSGRTAAATYPGGTPIEITLQSADPAAPLEANRRYFYRVRYRAPGESVFRARGERSFRTQRPRGETFTFTVTADPHLDEVTNPGLLRLAMRNMGADAPDFHVDLGDIFMTDKLATILPGIQLNYDAVEYRAVALRAYFEELCHSVPFFYTLGNHEAEYRYVYEADRTTARNSNNSSWNLLARKLYYPTPVPDAFYAGSRETRQVAGKDELLENYYAWEWGEALFVVLDPFGNTTQNPNSNPPDNWRWTLGRTQYDWLKRTLEGSRARYKFLFLHHLVGGTTSARGGVETAHRYEWGGRNLDGSEGFAEKRPGWGQPIHALLVANKVSAVFHGHDHFYGYQTLDGVVYQECPQPGTGNFSTGSSREGEYTTGVILPNSGHLRVTVSPANAKVEYVRAALPTQETASLRNRTVAHTYTIAPAN